MNENSMTDLTLTTDDDVNPAISIAVSRQLEGDEAEGSVLVRRRAGLSPDHSRLAGARAWSLLGTRRLQAGDAVAATQCALAGLDELGPDYRPRGVMDSSGLKISAAHGRIRDGFPVDGATVLLRILRERIALYLIRYADDIVE